MALRRRPKTDSPAPEPAPLDAPSLEELAATHARIRATGDLELGSHALLDWLRSWLAEKLPTLSLSRGAVHLRSSEHGYRGLFTREWLSHDMPPLSPSATVWSRIEMSNASVWLDLGTCRGHVFETGESFRAVPAQVSFERSASVLQMIERQSTHVFACPMRGSAGLEGMLTLELADHRGTQGTSLAHATTFAAAVELVAPSVLSLAARSPTRERQGQWPVVGIRTRPLLSMLHTLAVEDEALLLEGPRGAGKSHLAELCHALSPRSEGPFVVARLSALPRDLQRLELLGRTGAEPFEGALSRAHGGTLVLDGVDSLAPDVQALVADVVENKRYVPEGSSTLRTSDLRLVVLTSIPLLELRRDGRVGEELFYRLNVFPLRIPPLAQRHDEIDGWARHFAQLRVVAHGRSAEGLELTQDASALLVRAPWPGELRQLDNVVRRALAFRKLTPSRHVRLDREAIAAAIARENDSNPTASGESALTALLQTARLIATEAIERNGDRGRITLADLDVLRGAVLRAATERLGTSRAAYEALGAESFVASRNHARDYKRHLEAVEHLARKLKR